MKKNQSDEEVTSGQKEEAWIEATIQFINASEEDRSGFVAECMELGAEGSAEAPVFVQDPQDDSKPCEACGTSTRQSVYFPNSMGIETVLGLLDRQISRFFRSIPDFSARVLQCRRIAREEWGTDWMHTFPPERMGTRLWTVPPWEKSPSLPAGALSIVIEPGLAFGTGKHATTRHCLQFLEEIASDRGSLPGSFLDAGCGSAILSIAASLLGAEKPIALEIDPEAIPAATKNLQRNNLSEEVRLVNGPLECCRGRFELIAANLTASILTGYAGLLASLLEEGGLCVLSGILVSEKPEILELFRGSGLHPLQEKVDEDEGWSTLLFQKTGRP